MADIATLTLRGNLKRRLRAAECGYSTEEDGPEIPRNACATEATA
jgi:plasmid stability protein